MEIMIAQDARDFMLKQSASATVYMAESGGC